MPRNVQFQVLRGTQVQLSGLQGGVDPDTGLTTSALAWGEMYFATDTANLFFGTPGVGVGYIQVGDMAQVNEQLSQLIVLTECVRRALVQIACEGKKANEADFDPTNISTEQAMISPIGR